MPRFEPFHALRYADSNPENPSLDRLIAPPYDVLSEDEIAELNARSDHNISRVDNPRGGADRYDRAGAELRDWRERGVLVADPRPSFTIYRLRFTDAAGHARDVAGVLGGLEVVDDGAGGVLPHERTTPKASTDRLDLTRATRANLSPVWGLSLAAGLTDLLRAPGEPMGRVVDDGVEHLVERVDDPARIAAIAELLAAHDVLIADGHHRYGISRTYRDEQRAANPAEPDSVLDGGAELTLAFVNELVAEQLSVEAIHRAYSGVPYAELRSALSRSFDLAPADDPGPQTLGAMAADGFLVLLGPDGAERLTTKPHAFDDVRSLDGAWLETALADLLASGALDVRYQHGLDETVAAVQAGEASAAVLIRPVSVAEIERTAREGLLMPPKSTFFTPKLKTGLVVRAMTR